jgi:amino acid transporter
MVESGTDVSSGAKAGKITLRGAIFLGVGSMVGAGIFALFGEAGAVAGAAVWASFLVAGIIAVLQGYSFAKLGARYPSSGGLIDWIVRGYGSGLFTGGVVVLGYFSMVIVAAMVAISFGNYAAELFLGDGAAEIWVKGLAVAVVIVMTFLNMVGADAVARAQSVIVTVVLIVLSGFAVAMLLQADPSMLSPADYPPTRQILASVALTFFAYLGFGVLAFTGGDLENPSRNLPRALYVSIGFVMVLYVSLSVGVFGTLTVDQVVANAETALAVAALPIFGAFGYTMISIAAVFATAGAINSQLYATIGATFAMAKDGHLPPAFGLKRRQGGTQGLVITAVLTIVMAIFFDLGAVASLGSAVSLAIFALITVAHLRMAKETKASIAILGLALVATIVAILLFGGYTLATDPQTFAVLLVIIVLAWVVEAVWRSISRRELKPATLATEERKG